MLEKWYNSHGKMAVIMIILFITFITLPSFLYAPFELNIYTPENHKIGKANETVEFEWIFEQEGGIRRHYVIRDIESHEGDWSISINRTSFSVPPDSTIKIYITFKIPEDAQNGDKYHFQFSCYEKQDEAERVNDCASSYTVTVDNRDPPEIEINPGHGSLNSSGTCFRISPFIIIPLIIFIFFFYLLIMAISYQRQRRHLPPRQPENS